jgi:hypothetical protein
VRQRHDHLNRLLVGDADGSLQRIERAAFHREVRRATVAAVADVARVAARSRAVCSAAIASPLRNSDSEQLCRCTMLSRSVFKRRKLRSMLCRSEACDQFALLSIPCG